MNKYVHDFISTDYHYKSSLYSHIKLKRMNVMIEEF
jgi:hypothetical protein